MATSLENGIAAAKTGNKHLAMQHLTQAVRENPRDIIAWLWISSLVDDLEKKRYCYKKVLEIDPNNKYALQGMNPIRNTNNAGIHQSSPQQKIVEPQIPTIQDHKTQPKPINMAIHQPLTQKQNTEPRTVVTKPQPVQQPNGQASKTSQAKHSSVIKPSSNISISTIFKIIGWGFLTMVLIGVLADSKDAADFSARLLVGFYILWALSGYYGAWLLIKKGHGLGLGGCAILAGGTPILLPLVLGGFMYLWGKTAKDKHAAPEAYLVCPYCKNPTPMKSAFCSNCGKQIPQSRKKN